MLPKQDRTGQTGHKVQRRTERYSTDLWCKHKDQRKKLLNVQNWTWNRRSDWL